MFGGLIPQPLSAPLGKMEPVSNQNRSLLNSQIGIISPVSTNPASLGVQKVEQIGPMQGNVGLQIPLLPTKRKTIVEPSLPNKRVVRLEVPHNPPQQSLTNKGVMRNESMSNRTVSPRVQTPKSKAALHEVSPKAQCGSYEAVRMKMRENIAAALSVGNQDKDTVLSEDKSALHESAHIVGETAADDSFGNTFFVKDDLLQGNGLSWAWNLEVAKLNEAQTDKNMNLGEKNLSANGIGQTICSPQELAVKVELELYKLFGGVNKKYKEKGRSLMFNLKDTSNPELREKVLSSEITPERLCSMTPEELASKELSEWRVAKAEELDKMIVLPDSDIDMRRLVRKTHKGEFQVEIDQVYDDVSVEVSVGSSSATRFREKTKTDHLSSMGDEVKVKEKMDDSSHLTVSTDGADYMQEIIVDELKDEGALLPVLSLDEFMESLDSEPPFEDLSVDCKETQVQLDKDNLETGGEGNEKASSGITSVNSVEAETITNNNKSNVKLTEALSSMKTSETSSSAEPLSESIGECLWEGNLQLTLSSSVPFIGVFKSGEKTSTKEWPGFVEIKGRVRFSAFEKFLQELPMSRTRAVMVVHFVLKDASSLLHQASLSETMDSYVADERVGFGEPIPGVEVYFCPPHKRTTETLNRLLSKDQTDTIESPQNGLIGVAVWRRTTLPNSHSQPKHHRKHLSYRRHDNINANTNSNMISKSLRLLPQSNNARVDDDGDDDDDAPPGFGPGVVAQDEDDLPEFSFSKGSNSSGQTLPAQSSMGPPTRPVGHMRHLVYQYGQTNNTSSETQTGTQSRHWNQDDDIPEWKPQVQKGHVLQVPNHMHLANQVIPTGYDMTPFMPNTQPVNVMQNSYVQMPVPHGLQPPNAFLPGQYYGGQWRQG